MVCVSLRQHHGDTHTIHTHRERLHPRADTDRPKTDTKHKTHTRHRHTHSLPHVLNHSCVCLCEPLRTEWTCRCRAECASVCLCGSERVSVCVSVTGYRYVDRQCPTHTSPRSSYTHRHTHTHRHRHTSHVEPHVALCVIMCYLVLSCVILSDRRLS